MEPLIIQGDENTPDVNFDGKTGQLTMKGIAIPEDIREIFVPIKEWLAKYQESPQPATELLLFFEYLNTAASKMVFEIGSTISELHARDNCRVKIIWQYTRGDSEMHELGEEMIEDFFCLTEISVVDEI